MNVMNVLIAGLIYLDLLSPLGPQDRLVAPTNLSGPWILSQHHPFGADDFAVVLRHDGSKISGTGAFGSLDSVEVAGELKGQAITFTMTTTAKGQSYTSHFTGVVDSARATLTGRWRTGDNEVEDAWTAKRTLTGSWTLTTGSSTMAVLLTQESQKVNGSAIDEDGAKTPVAGEWKGDTVRLILERPGMFRSGQDAGLVPVTLVGRWHTDGSMNFTATVEGFDGQKAWRLTWVSQSPGGVKLNWFRRRVGHSATQESDPESVSVLFELAVHSLRAGPSPRTSEGSCPAGAGTRHIGRDDGSYGRA